jgi:hypothetical protein
MQKTIFILVLIMCIALFDSFAQKKSMILVYDFNSYGGYKSQLKLYVDERYAKFVFHTEDVTLKEEYYHYFEHFENFYNLKNGGVIEYRKLRDSTKIQASWKNSIKWKITEETKVINGYKTQKATAESYNTDGRGDWDYGDAIAWFTQDIPLPIGPERYYGLPGLIVKLEFAKRPNKVFILNTLEYKPFVLSAPNFNAVVVAPEEIVRPSLLKDKLKDKKWRAGARELLLNDN